MKNWYLIIGVVSILFILPLLAWDSSKWKDVLAAIGESGIAAIIIALMIEAWHRREQQRKGKVYLGPFRRELLYLLGRIAWFDERVSDPAFNWNLPLSDYWTKQYAVQALTKYPGHRLDPQAVGLWVKDFAMRYSTDAVAAMPSNDQARTVQMFRIVAAGSKELVACAGEMKSQRLTLAAEGILPLEKNECMSINVGIAMGLLVNGAGSVKNYGLVPQLILDTYNQVCDCSTAVSEVFVDLHCTLSYSEI